MSSEGDRPSQFLGMTLQVYLIDGATGERRELPVTKSVGSPRDSYPPCRCPRCRPEAQAAVDRQHPSRAALPPPPVAGGR